MKQVKKSIYKLSYGIKSLFTGMLIIIYLLSAFSCNKFVEVPAPKDQLINTTVFANSRTATAAITGIYSSMMSTNGFASGGYGSVTFLGGLSADELVNYSVLPDLDQFYTNNLTATNSIIQYNIWNEAYSYIYSANAAIEGLNNSTGISLPLKNQLEGEAKFIRAFCHFYLVNLFGDVPYITTTDYLVNAMASRSASSMVFQNIISDLEDAQNLLANDYSYSNGEKVRPNKWAATALLARVYLYEEDWADAATQATAVITSGNYGLENDLNNVFLKNSTEAIWQLMPVIPDMNTNEGYFFILQTTPYYVALNKSLLDAFEVNDKRRIDWVDSFYDGTKTYYFPYKYHVKNSPVLTEYSMVLRLSEQYLIRAEARAQQNNIASAKADLNIIRNRAGLPNTTAENKEALLTAIEHERQTELFCEWGHRWLDLKRTGRSDIVLKPIKPGWQAKDSLYPIPQLERQTDPHLTQNPGY